MLSMPNMKSLPSIFYSPSIGYELKDSFRTSTNMGLSKTSWDLVTIYVAAYTLTKVAVANLHLSKNSHCIMADDVLVLDLLICRISEVVCSYEV